MTTGIYKIVCPYGHVYIGQSINIEKRFRQHKANRTKGYAKLKSSFNYHGSYNHLFEIIEECEFEQLNNREKYWFDYYHNNGYEMLNSMKIPEGIKKVKNKTERVIIPNCSSYSIVSDGQVIKHGRPANTKNGTYTNDSFLDFKIDKHNNVCVRMKTDDGIHKDFIVDDIIVDVFLEKGHTYYKIKPDWESRCAHCKKKFNNRVNHFLRKDLYEQMIHKPIIYKTIKT